MAQGRRITDRAKRGPYDNDRAKANIPQYGSSKLG